MRNYWQLGSSGSEHSRWTEKLGKMQMGEYSSEFEELKESWCGGSEWKVERRGQIER